MPFRQVNSRSAWLFNFVWVCLAVLAAGCRGQPAGQAAGITTPTETITLYGWAEDIPPTVLEAFQAEYGVQVQYLTYDSSEEAAESIRAGGRYDVAVLENRSIPGLVSAGKLARIRPSDITNFKNITTSFRDLVYDPGNQYSIPFNWGTTGLVVRADRLVKPLYDWAGLWELPPGAKIAMWRGEPRDGLGIALKSLGFSPNSEQPEELEAALERLMGIRDRVIFVEDFDVTRAGQLLERGEAVAAVGYAVDVLEGRKVNPAIRYILPQEGALMWGDNFTILADSPKQANAGLFINFLLRPEISAQIANYNRYATPNEAAFPFIDPEIMSDPVIFPPTAYLMNAEIILPLSLEGEQLYDRVWRQFTGDESRGAGDDH